MATKQERNGWNREERHLKADGTDKGGKAIGMARARVFPSVSEDVESERNAGEATPTSTAETETQRALREEGRERRNKGTRLLWAHRRQGREAGVPVDKMLHVMLGYIKRVRGMKRVRGTILKVSGIPLIVPTIRFRTNLLKFDDISCFFNIHFEHHN